MIYLHTVIHFLTDGYAALLGNIIQACDIS